MVLAKPASPLWQPARAPLACDLYLPFEAGSGISSRDFGPKRLTAQFGISGANLPTWGKSAYGPAVTFDGSSSVIATNVTEPAPTGTSKISLLALIYPTNISTYHTIACRRNGSSASWQFRIGNASGDGLLAFTYSSGAGVYYQSDPSGITTVPLSEWSVVGFSVDFSTVSASGLAYWMNGAKATAGTVIPVGVPDNAACPTTIGRRYDNSMPFAGQIAAVVRAPIVWSDSTFRSLSADLLSGQFSAVRRRTNMALFSFGSGTAYFSTLSESATTADSITGATTFAPTLAASVTAADSTTALGSFVSTIAESATSSDSVAAVATFFASLTESSTASDGMSAPLPGSETIIETVTASDAYVASTAFAPTLAEVVTASDSIAATAVFVTSIDQAVSGFDSYSIDAGGTLSFKEALAAAIKADATLSALIGSRVNPTKLRQTQTYPALTFRVVSRSWSTDLDGFANTCDAEVEFSAHSDKYSDCEHIVLAVRKLFHSGQFPALLSGVKVNFTLPRDDDDDYAPAEDASDRGTFTDSISILFSYVLI